MSVLIDFIQFALNAQGAVCDDTTCPTTAYSAITAAFATQGYYQQADMLYFLNNTGLSKLAGLIYILAGFTGIVQMVLGAPPRNYMWFFIGPAVYNWLVLTPSQSYGVRWMSYPGVQAANEQDNQKEVTRIQYAGLQNSNYILRNNITLTKDTIPSQPAQVSLFFLWVDLFFSDLTENLIRMIGVHNLVGPHAPASGNTRNWGVLTDLKWGKIEEITSAQLLNGNTRDAFITFLASECGDHFSAQIDEASWIAAAAGNGVSTPASVLKTNQSLSISYIPVFPYFTAIPVNTSGPQFLADALGAVAIPLPDSLKNLLANGLDPITAPSFTNSAPALQTYIKEIKNRTRPYAINCAGYLQYLVHAFRYEAAGIYNQLAAGAPGEFEHDPEAVIYNLLYGWGIEDLPEGVGTDSQKRERYLTDLILVHLIRNEMRYAPKPVDVRYASSKTTETYVKEFVKATASKTKYAEVYSWALMVPYFQGILMYFLAMSFPFVALMVIVPGWGKGVISWMTFWIWVKTWDVGIAIVKILERSIWAALQNNSNAAYINGQVVQMAKWQNSTLSCFSPSGNKIGDCIIPKLTFTGSANGLDTPVESFQLFDRALTLAANLDLDLTNSYYIYIMAALYFAVPAVTGQIVLGAKAGATSLVGGAVSGLGEKVSSAAASGFTGEQVQMQKSNQASAAQASQAKTNRANGLMAGALGTDNLKAFDSMTSAGLSGISKQASGVGGAKGQVAQMYATAAQLWQQLSGDPKKLPFEGPTPTGVPGSAGAAPGRAPTPQGNRTPMSNVSPAMIEATSAPTNANNAAPKSSAPSAAPAAAPSTLAPAAHMQGNSSPASPRAAGLPGTTSTPITMSNGSSASAQSVTNGTPMAVSASSASSTRAAIGAGAATAAISGASASGSMGTIMSAYSGSGNGSMASQMVQPGSVPAMAQVGASGGGAFIGGGRGANSAGGSMVGAPASGSIATYSPSAPAFPAAGGAGTSNFVGGRASFKTSASANGQPPPLPAVGGRHAMPTTAKTNTIK